MEQEVSENDRNANVQKFKGRGIAAGSRAPGKISGVFDDGPGDSDEEVKAPAPRNNSYQFNRQEYGPQGLAPQHDFLDSRLITELEEVSIPFPIIKIGPDAKQGGSHYVFGTKCVLIRELDEDQLMVREYKTESDTLFSIYAANQSEQEWKQIQEILRTNKQDLLESSDPVLALSKHFEQTYKKLLNL